MPIPDVAAGRQSCTIGGIVFDPLQHGLSSLPALVFSARTFISRQSFLERLYKVGFGAQEHAANKIRSGNARGPLDDFESASSLDIAVAILAIAI
jgi:hypothetical protein